MSSYDVGIIGSGPCGYVAAIRAAQSGMKVCVFEKAETGGVCLNRGCIPTKALAAIALRLESIRDAAQFGIDVRSYSVDFSAVMKRKDNVVKRLSSGIEMLFKARKVVYIREKAVIAAPGRVRADKEEIAVKDILLATGSLPQQLKGMEFDDKKIISSSDLMAMQTLPESLLIVGGGVIGCELASILNAFGSKVTIVEMMEQLLPGHDREIASRLEQQLKKRGVKIFTSQRVSEIKKTENAIKAVLSEGAYIEAEKAMIAVGRAPNSSGLGLEEAGVHSEKGWIKVGPDFKTSVEHIYAAGDVKGGILLAHVASREGIAAINAINGIKDEIDYNAVPSCIFTEPEISSVGLNESQAIARGLSIRTRKFPFSAIGKAHAIGKTDGFVKLVVENGSDRILGAQMIGPSVTELIAEFTLCVQSGITSERLASVIHAHPTLSEIAHEVSEAINNRPIHSL